MPTTEVPFLLGVAFVPQAVRGTPETMPIIGDPIGVNEGAVLGDPDSGVGETGITISYGKDITEKAPLTGSYTRDFGNYIGRTIETFSMAFPMKGNGNTTTATPVGSDFLPDVGIDALFRAAGLAGSAEVGPARYAYVPDVTNVITAAVYSGNASGNGLRTILQDVEGQATFAFTPGEIAICTVEMVGEFSSYDESGTWGPVPIDYGNQASLSAPPIRAAQMTWGPSTPDARALGFSTLEIAISTEGEEIQASNSPSGTLTRQTGRTIEITGTIDAAAEDLDYEIEQLGEELIANSHPLSFTIGEVATGNDTANAYRITIPSPELVQLDEADPLGTSQARGITMTARATTANGEFELAYL